MVTAAILGAKLIESFNRQDLLALNDVLHPQLISYITNREGGITELKGSKAFKRKRYFLEG